MRTEASVSNPLVGLAGTTVAAVYLLVLFEWLFQVTKPSMFTLVGWPQRVGVLMTTALLASLPVVAVVLLIALAWGRLGGRWRGRAARAALVVPAAVLSAGGFLLVENFTRTVFGFNVGSFTSPVRYLYAVGWLALAWWVHRSLAGALDSRSRRGGRALATATAIVLLGSLVAAWVRYEPSQAAAIGERGRGEPPNVLILAADGLDAGSMSVYGYERPTTPFLDSRIDEFLVSENHFSNSARTGAAIGALLTGKLPTDTGLVRSGMAFRGEHVFQHLPGLLRQLGYYNIDISIRHFGDAYDLNIRQGFHVANGRSSGSEALPVLGWLGRVYPAERHFVGLTVERLRERLLHAAGVVDMEDVFDVVAKKKTPRMVDGDRIEMLEAELEGAPRPFFAHVHLLDTHRPFLKTLDSGASDAGRRFSTGPVPDRRDLYDDLVAGYDDHVRRVVTELEASGELDRTVLILDSDHGMYRTPGVRLPLLMRFPGAEFAGRLRSNTQRIDIAPTVLAYLGVEPPEWMSGEPLIEAQPDPQRPILVAGWGGRKTVRWLSVIQCQRVWAFDARTGRTVRRAVDGHTVPCPEEDLWGETEARRYLYARLEDSGAIPVSVSARLGSLQLDNNPDTRRQAALAIRRGELPVLKLGDSISLAQVYPDFWTEGTQPGAILLRNDAGVAQPHALVVGSGSELEFPASFFVQDDERTREYVFERPGTLSVELGEVAPGAERMFLVWSGSSWNAGKRGRVHGVRLDPSGSWLWGLMRGRRSSDWREAARLIHQRRAPATRLAENVLAVNVHADLWTRGEQPAGLVVHNPGSEPVARRVVVNSGAGHEFPLRLHLHGGGPSREYLFERPGSVVVELPEVPPGSERLFVLRSEGGWTPGPRPVRRLGVRLSAG